MLNFLRALAVLAVVLMGPAMARAQGADSAALSWKVTGELTEVPGQPPTVPFSCTVTSAAPRCSLPTGSIAIDFEGVDSDSFRAQFNPQRPCGGGDLCTPLFNLTDTVNQQIDSVTCNGSTITAAPSAPVRAYFPCSLCFGGEKPSFGLNWKAVADCTTSTTSSTSTSSTSTSSSSTTTST